MAQPAGVLDLIEQLGFLVNGDWLIVSVHSAFVGIVTPSAPRFKCLIIRQKTRLFQPMRGFITQTFVHINIR